MSKVSASTLARQAAKTTNKAEAKRLRAQAAKLRRDARKPKRAGLTPSMIGLKPRPMKGLPDRQKIIKRVNRVNRAIETGKHSGIVVGLDPRLMQPDEEMFGDGRTMRAASVDHTPLANAPGHGEIVGGYLASKAKEIAELARKKGGVDAIQTELAWLEAQTKHDAKFDARQREHKAVQAVREEMRDNSLCGFIALVDAANQTKSMVPVSFISSDLVGHIIDALKANGYSANGKR